MSNHIHLLIQAKNNDLPDVWRDFKKFTLLRITDAIANNERKVENVACRPVMAGMLWLFKQPEDKATNKTNYQFWKSDNHAELCFSLPFAWQKLTYIHNNSLRETVG